MLRKYVSLAATAGGMVLWGGCLPQHQSYPAVPPPAVVTKQDSVQEAWRLVYAYVRAVDHYARPRGVLPSSLQPIVNSREAGPDTDPWGRTLQYRENGPRFEVRSAGSDGVFETSDDVTALGQLGRNQPCEIRDEFRVWTGVGFEPPCDTSSTVLVLPECPQLYAHAQRDDEKPPTRSDSVRIMGLRLVRIARGVDRAGRELGGLPLNLRPVPSFHHLTLQDIGDIWGRPLRYQSHAREYEVRSAGVDGVFDNDDDIVVDGTLGRALPCTFHTERGVETCEEPPPACPDSSESTNRPG